MGGSAVMHEAVLCVNRTEMNCTAARNDSLSFAAESTQPDSCVGRTQLDFVGRRCRWKQRVSDAGVHPAFHRARTSGH